MTAAEAAMDSLELRLTWSGGQARLESLTDNGEAQDVPDGVAANRVVVPWESSRASLHELQWDLMFAGTRTNLRAEATLNGETCFEPVTRASATDRWSASGACV